MTDSEIRATPQHESKPKPILSRRRLLQHLFMGGTAGALAGSGVGGFLLSWLNRSPGISSAQAGEKVLNHQQAMLATVSALKEEERTESFVPTGEFDQQDYESLKAITLQIAFYGEVKKQSTAWVQSIDQRTGTMTIVTSGHTVHSGENDSTSVATNSNSTLYIANPNYKPVGLKAQSFTVHSHPNLDLATIEVCFSDMRNFENFFSMITADSVLPVMDQQTSVQVLDPGMRLLSVGYPKVLEGASYPGSMVVGSDVYTIANIDSQTSEINFFHAVNSHGGSGSPVAVKIDGLLFVVGLVNTISMRKTAGSADFPVVGGVLLDLPIKEN